MRDMIDFYTSQKSNYKKALAIDNKAIIDDIINNNPQQISWSRAVKKSLQSKTDYIFDKQKVFISAYRPFTRNYFYFSRDFNECVYQQPNYFPNVEILNYVIVLSGVGANKDFSCLISNNVVDYQTFSNGQCFPLYYYDEVDTKNATLFDDVSKEKYIRRDAISDFILERCRANYGNKVGKEDIFYYVYGILHSTEYRTQFASDLKKMLPRLPLIDEPKEFWAFSKAGRALAELHLNYETIEPSKEVRTIFGKGSEVSYRVEKMRFAKEGKETDKSRIIYNQQITIENIPLVAYDYVVNGKSAIEWIMERYAITTHKDSGITNNPNDWATEHNDPKYIYNL